MNARKIKLSVHSWQKSIIKMNETELWIKIENFFVEHFQTEKNPPIETLLFLIGIQELGSGQQKYSKDDKINLLHIAVCRLLEPFGFYQFEDYIKNRKAEYLFKMGEINYKQKFEMENDLGLF